MARMKLKRLRNVEISEVSLVDKPAFTESVVLLMKNRVATIDGIKFTGKPTHEWAYIEPVEGGRSGDLLLLATATIVAAGDPMAGGGAWSAADVETLYLAWAAPRAVKPVRGACPMSLIMDRDGAPNVEARTVAWGLTDKAGLNLFGAGDSELPKDAFFVQVLIAGETAKKLVGDKRVLNGLALVGAALIGKGTALHSYDLDSAADVERLADDVVGRLADDPRNREAILGEYRVDPVQLADDLSAAIANGLADADRDTVAASDLGHELAKTALATLIEAHK